MFLMLHAPAIDAMLGSADSRPLNGSQISVLMSIARSWRSATAYWRGTYRQLAVLARTTAARAHAALIELQRRGLLDVNSDSTGTIVRRGAAFLAPTPVTKNDNTPAPQTAPVTSSGNAGVTKNDNALPHIRRLTTIEQPPTHSSPRVPSVEGGGGADQSTATTAPAQQPEQGHFPAPHGAEATQRQSECLLGDENEPEAPQTPASEPERNPPASQPDAIRASRMMTAWAEAGGARPFPIRGICPPEIDQADDATLAEACRQFHADRTIRNRSLHTLLHPMMFGSFLERAIGKMARRASREAPAPQATPASEIDALPEATLDRMRDDRDLLGMLSGPALSDVQAYRRRVTTLRLRPDGRKAIATSCRSTYEAYRQSYGHDLRYDVVLTA